MNVGTSNNMNLGLPISKIFNDRYVVPLYQRNFAWRQDEIKQLLQDVYDAFKSGAENYYIGSLVVLRRHNGDYEVIDGQQRLTTLSLITSILGKNSNQVFFYDSRPEVESFFSTFHKNRNVDDLDAPGIFYLKEAITTIKESNLSLDETEFTGIDNTKEYNKINFADFFMEHVILVRVEIPDDTDVAAYFEIMNNRGEQLKKHEILKALMLAKIKDDTGHYDIAKQKQFAKIWDACSNMNVPVQRMFLEKEENDKSIHERTKYFGKDYTNFYFTAADAILQESNLSGFSIDEIISEENLTGADSSSISDDETDDSKYKSIIDFPNFLMHVFKLYAKNSNASTATAAAERIPLNEKYLLSVYKDVEVDSMNFIEMLLFYRTVFDRFIIKSVDDENSEDGYSWTLIKPKKYKSSWTYVRTFDKQKNENDSEEDTGPETRLEPEQARIVKALSMLQVTFRNRIYKNWMQPILEWFNGKDNILNDITSLEYLQVIDKIMLDFYNSSDFSKITAITGATMISPDNSYSSGVKTPHFLFNFIDYLYWVKNENTNETAIRDFEFKYWNSVEHHLAINKASNFDRSEYEGYINNLGNLCLISRSVNSRLSDRDVKEKVMHYSKGNLGANRQIIYKITENNNYNWGKEQIKQHYQELVQLLSERENILNFVLHNYEK